MPMLSSILRSSWPTFPSGLLAADASFMKAECLFKQEKYAKAVGSLSVCAQDEAAIADGSGDAAVHAGQAAAQLKNWAGSAALLITVDRESAGLAVECGSEL